MICRHCGARMRTIETRHIRSGYVVKRKVKCANDHVYFTFETDDGLWKTIDRLTSGRAGAFERSALRFKRNETVRKARKAGRSLAWIAQRFGRSESTIVAICKHKK